MNYILKLKNQFTKYKIIVGETEEIEYDKTSFKYINYLVNKVHNDKKLLSIYHKYTIFNKPVSTIHSLINIYNYRSLFLGYFNINNEHFITVPSFNNINKFRIYDYNKILVKNKLVETATFMFNKKFYKNQNFERELLLQKMMIIVLYNLNKILKPNGNLTLRIYNFIDNKTFFIITLLLSKFKYGYISHGYILYLIGYNNNNNNDENDENEYNNIIKNIFNNNLIFKFNINIQSKIQYIINYVQEYANIGIERLIYIITKDKKNLNKLVEINNLKIFLDFGLYKNLDLRNFELILYDILKNNNNNINDKFYLINVLNYYIKKYNFKNILEIGSSEGIIPSYLLKFNNNIHIKSIYYSNIIYNNIIKYLNIYKERFKLLIGINNIKLDNIKKLVIVNLFKDNYNNIKLFNKINKIIKKGNIIIINNIDNYILNYNKYFKKYIILKKSFNFIILKK